MFKRNKWGFHKAVHLEFLEGTTLKVTFADGKAKIYDMMKGAEIYPPLAKLQNRELFLAGKLNPYGIIWNDELDYSVETIYRDGEDTQSVQVPLTTRIAYGVFSARTKAGLSQKQLAERTHIDQADISKIESGKANPSLNTIERIFNALGKTLDFTVSPLPDGSAK